ncbi:MAG: hypothetical protein K5750_10720, partial [Eubacterium sp.]|nr:hypothetical protein [Eubacterium sp.]
MSEANDTGREADLMHHGCDACIILLAELLCKRWWRIHMEALRSALRRSDIFNIINKSIKKNKLP